jgi:hypothetical protein
LKIVEFFTSHVFLEWEELVLKKFIFLFILRGVCSKFFWKLHIVLNWKLYFQLFQDLLCPIVCLLLVFTAW